MLMNVLGINSAYHESSAALVVHGRIVAAVEEERFNRVKHGKPADVDNAHELPSQSIAFCLRQGRLEPGEIDVIAFSFDPERRRSGFKEDPLGPAGDWGSLEGEATFMASLATVPDEVSAVLGPEAAKKLVYVPHHTSHAASVYHPSGFEEAAILVIDGIGEASTGLLSAGKGTTISRLDSIAFPNSLGFAWEKLSKFLGFSEYDAAKVMGLAGYGDPRPYEGAFEQLIAVSESGFHVNAGLLRFRDPDLEHLSALLGPPRRREDPIEQRHYDIAASLQQQNDRAVLAIAAYLHDTFGSRALCFAGGVALNCVTNYLLKEQGPFEQVYIPSAPHDAGTAVGAALHAYHSREDATTTPMPSQALVPGAYTGPAFDDIEIQAAFSSAGIEHRRSADVTREVAAMLADGKIVGWFQGAMEFGPRALGNRSLLADPRDRATRERLNRRVKHRESFRPFGPSVLAEHADEWFEIGKSSDSYNYMLFAAPVKPEVAERIPAVLHADNTSRVQLVSPQSNERYHRLISEFHELSEVPMVLNTSFNDNEPLVCTPADAVATFCSTEIDALVIGDWIATRNSSQ